MASTPSASALTAVLRCRGNIWTAPSARLTGSTARDLPVKTASLWEAFTHGQRVVLGRLALSCNVPWKKRKAEKVRHGISRAAHAHTQGHAREPTSVCTRPSPCAPRAKVVFVCETRACPRGLDTAEQKLWVSVTGACVSLTSVVSHFVLGRLMLLIRPGTDQQDECPIGPIGEDPQTRGAAADSCPDGGSADGARVTQDRPD